jgi:RNA polymerase sigma-70 factor, ECF subfamily
LYRWHLRSSSMVAVVPPLSPLITLLAKGLLAQNRGVASMYNPPQFDQDQLLQLISRCTLKDQKSFQELYQLTSAKLFGIALRILKHKPHAEEALQEAYLKVWRNAGNYNSNSGKPMTWLISIVRNQSLDMLRASSSRQEDAHEEFHDEIEDSLNLSRDIETSEELNHLLHCMKSLTENQQKCLLMVYHQGYTSAEVSAWGNWPLGTVKSWLRRGLASIRGCVTI